MKAAPVLALEEVTFETGGARHLGPLDLRLDGAGRTVVMGPNGAGKSLTLRLAHGLLRPSSGRVVGGPESGGRRQAMVFDRPVLLRRSVAANVDYALAVRGFPREARRQRRDEVLERTGLAPLAERAARRLSGGEQQRLALARAWALDPQILFLDEPTAVLDPTATAAIEALILAISGAGTQIVMTTHDLGQARRLAQEVVFLHRGRLEERAPADAFFEAPRSPAARAYLAGELPW